VFDVENVVDRKVAALAAHRSQMAPGPLDRLTAEEARRWLGREHFHRSPHGGQGRVLEALGAA
jgi:LmbE family N-acetylglucosaminyl deacetylase